MKLNAEQKSVKWMLDLLYKFDKIKERRWNTFAATYGTVVACLPLSNHRVLVYCKKVSACVQNTQPLLVEMYAKLVLSSKSNEARI